ncbi:hypothetical protein [Streptomyces alboflavus]|uniref:hypothetical protein n=1 Tax=Streptomyces alboflavus TaxID=67267 RepID=UPI0006915109|nr:hypothetical protein [Streptomyces alboflavus]
MPRHDRLTAGPPARRGRRGPSFRPPRVPAVLATAVLLVAALAACGSGADAPAARGGRDDAPRRLSDTERYRLAHAEQALIAACMAERGQPYRVWLPLSVAEGRPVGPILDDPRWAREHGYGSRIEAKLTKAKRANPNLAHLKSLTGARRTAYLTALTGGAGAPEMKVTLPTGATITNKLGGCSAYAEKRLYGDRRTWFVAEKTASNLTPLYASKLARVPAYRAAVASWSRCVRTHGYTLASPAAARDRLRTRIPKLPADARFAAEVRLAVAEARCARETRLRQTGQQAEDALRDELPQRIQRELRTHSRLQRAALDRARDVVGTS